MAWTIAARRVQASSAQVAPVAPPACSAWAGSEVSAPSVGVCGVEELRADVVRLTERLSHAVAANADLLCERQRATQRVQVRPATWPIPAPVRAPLYCICACEMPRHDWLNARRCS